MPTKSKKTGDVAAVKKRGAKTSETEEKKTIKKAEIQAGEEKKTTGKSSAARGKTVNAATKGPAAQGRKRSVQKIQAEQDTPPAAVKEKRKVLFAASECQPFIATGGLGDVAGSLPKSILRDYGDYDIRVVLPLYSDMQQKYRDQLEYVTSFYTTLAWRKQYCGVFRCVLDNVTYYFLDNEYYFKRAGLYGHFDDGERFAYFSKSILEFMPYVDFYPDIIHCNDWQTALVPIYLKTQFICYERYHRMRTIFTIHNIEYQGKYSLDILEDVFGISSYYTDLVEYNGLLNLMKGAIQCCDIVSTVSPTYAKEILSPYFSHGLHFILERNQYKLKGILNGIDLDAFNPETDPSLFAHYSAEELSGKRENKRQLQLMLNLPEDPDIPVVAIVSRLVAHKGMDLIRDAIEDLLKNRVQVVLLGKGDAAYENFFVDLQKIYSEKMRAIIAYNMDTSRKIYAGSDIFLMPSKSEPCGLSQMIASRYGSVPIVRETGGLYDSIKDIGCEGGGNGFTFASYNKNDLLNRLNAAIGMYQDRSAWIELVKRVMRVDFSWKKSAAEYVAMYGSIL